VGCVGRVSFDVIAAFGALLTPLSLLAGYIAMLYRNQISECRQELAAARAREKRMLQLILQGAEDEEKLAVELGRIITGSTNGNS
jgi:hypothetical protein